MHEGINLNMEELQKKLGDDADLFEWDQNDKVVVARLRNKVDRDEFIRLSEVFRRLNGKYVPWESSTGGGKYFEVKKEEAVKPSPRKTDLLVKDAIAYLEHALEKLKELQNLVDPQCMHSDLMQL